MYYRSCNLNRAVRAHGQTRQTAYRRREGEKISQYKPIKPYIIIQWAVGYWKELNPFSLDYSPPQQPRCSITYFSLFSGEELVNGLSFHYYYTRPDQTIRPTIGWFTHTHAHTAHYVLVQQLADYSLSVSDATSISPIFSDIYVWIYIYLFVCVSSRLQGLYTIDGDFKLMLKLIR